MVMGRPGPTDRKKSNGHPTLRGPLDFGGPLYRDAKTSDTSRHGVSSSLRGGFVCSGAAVRGAPDAGATHFPFVSPWSPFFFGVWSRSFLVLCCGVGKGLQTFLLHARVGRLHERIVEAEHGRDTVKRRRRVADEDGLFDVLSQTGQRLQPRPGQRRTVRQDVRDELGVHLVGRAAVQQKVGAELQAPLDHKALVSEVGIDAVRRDEARLARSGAVAAVAPRLVCRGVRLARRLV
mmetsp:Transcript_2913/g.8681  ORF Transcript_2913/g.8681 Transcript_2913/m.8681 type:complete len:235 (-) Transcript_2913:152-856(-)